LKELVVEREELRRKLQRKQKRVDYHKNKETKLLSLLFSL